MSTTKKQISFYADEDVSEFLDTVAPGVKSKIINDALRDAMAKPRTQAGKILWKIGDPPYNANQPDLRRVVVTDLSIQGKEWGTFNMELSNSAVLLNRLENDGYQVFSATPVMRIGRGEPDLVVVAHRSKQKSELDKYAESCAANWMAGITTTQLLSEHTKAYYNNLPDVLRKEVGSHSDFHRLVNHALSEIV